MKMASKRKIFKKGKTTQKSQKIPKKGQITKESREAFGEQVISYYLSLGDLKDAVIRTVQHLTKATRNDKRSVNRIIQRYKERGTWKWDSAPGRPTKFTSDDEFRSRFQELYDPSLTVGELATLLRVSRRTLKKYMRQLTEDRSQAQSSSDGENNHDGDPNLQQLDSVAFNEDAGFMDHSFQDDDDLNQDVKPHVSLDDIKLKLEAQAQNFPTSGPKSKNRSKQNASECLLKTCLICKQTFSQDFPKSTTGNTLQANCDVIFLLRKVLRIEAEELTNFLMLSEGQNPSDWYWLCDTCQRFQDEASSIRKQLQELELRMERCRIDFLSEVKQSSEEESKLLSKKGGRRGRGKRTNSSGVVAERLRVLILKTGDEQQRQQSLIRFENDDKQAEQLARERLQWTPVDIPDGGSTPQQPNPEMEDDFDFNSELFAPSPAEIDFSEPNPRKTQNSLKTEASTVPHQEGADIDFGSVSDQECLAPSSPPVLEEISETKAPKTGTRPKCASRRIRVANVKQPSGLNSKESSKRTLNSHFSTDFTLPTLGGPQAVFCDLCGAFIKNSNLSTHKLKVHGVVMEGFTVINCDVKDCVFRTFSKNKLERHKMKEHGAERPHLCKFCGKRFLIKNQLMQHEDIHRNKDTRPYVCSICGSRFAVRTYLYIHERVTHQRRKFPSNLGKQSREDT